MTPHSEYVALLLGHMSDFHKSNFNKTFIGILTGSCWRIGPTKSLSLKGGFRAKLNFFYNPKTIPRARGKYSAKPTLAPTVGRCLDSIIPTAIYTVIAVAVAASSPHNLRAISAIAATSCSGCQILARPRGVSTRLVGVSI